MSKAWVVRSGKYGERDAGALQSGCSGGGWEEIPDMTACTNREDIVQIAVDTYKGASDAKIAAAVGQLWRLRGRIKAGRSLGHAYEEHPSRSAWTDSNSITLICSCQSTGSHPNIGNPRRLPGEAISPQVVPSCPVGGQGYLLGLLINEESRRELDARH